MNLSVVNCQNRVFLLFKIETNYKKKNKRADKDLFRSLKQVLNREFK